MLPAKINSVHFSNSTFFAMDFSDRLAMLRKQRGLTQQQLADRTNVHLVQVNRYEAGASRPAVDVVKRLAVALSVSADALLFDEDEYGPDEDFRLLFDGLRILTDQEKNVVKSVLEAMLLKHRISACKPAISANEKIASIDITASGKGNQ
ncbi:helix-turn-helix domain-containing protein [Burkholderia mayonis]|nr:helix-turn-helix transcriptional regulator [Burkholderia mayonis]